MAKYKSSNSSQLTILPFDPSKQLLPGTFEYALSYIVENEINLEGFHLERKNDITGAPAYNPKIMLKVILFAYSKGIYTSRSIAKACEENTVFMALSSCSTPHYTSIAQFIATLGEKAKSIFLDVLLICDRLKLIGGTTFAIDGKKLSSNAAKELSGTKTEFNHKIKKLEKSLDRMMEQCNDESIPQEEYKRKVEKATKKINKIKKWVLENDDIVNKKNRPRKSNITDGDSCTMKSSSGIIQGYNCQAIVDSKNQVICGGFASGNPQDDGHLKPAVEDLIDNINHLEKTMVKKPKILADTAYHNNESLREISKLDVDPYVPDVNFRKRDPSISKKNWRKEKPKTHFDINDFKYNEKSDKYICPNKKELKLEKKDLLYFGRRGNKYRSSKLDCRECPLKSKCIKTEKSRLRYLFVPADGPERNYALEMKKKIDTKKARRMYSMRMGIVEPVFSNISYCKKLDRLTYRGQEKVNSQWLLYCIVNNVGKLSKKLA